MAMPTRLSATSGLKAKMPVDYFFPGTVLLLKLGFKIFVDQRFKWLTAARSLCVFSADLAFLCLSFGAITLSQAQKSSEHSAEAKLVMGLFALSVIALFGVTAVSRAINDAFDDEKYWLVIGLSAFGYMIALGVLWASVGISGVIR